jgi:endo-1,4-beta-mannosidase
MPQVIDPAQLGVSFSVKQCRNFEIDGRAALNWLIHEAGFRRFRLMSYWNEHEVQSGKYDFKTLDWQVKTIAKAGGEITLCLGARQPRWPENHWPDWAWQASYDLRTTALLKYVETVVEKYKNQPAIVSYQLENEALLKNFGEKAEVDRHRLRAEYALVKSLDASRPIIMTTSTSWGIPLRQPIPNCIGFSYYHTLYRNGGYHTSTFFPWVHRLRKTLIKLLHNRPVFIHELQLEPWGPTGIWKMPIAEQDKSMDNAAIARNVKLAQKIKAGPVDIWGGEWWYWRLTEHNDPSIWQAVQSSLADHISN